MANLYELTSEYKQLLDLLEEADLDEQVLKDTLEAVSGEFGIKAAGYVKIIRQLEANAEAYEKEADFYEVKMATARNNADKMRRAICNALIETGNEKGIQAEKFTIKVAGNGGKKPLKIIGDVPDAFKKVVYETDKSKIREALESGVELDWAYLEERGKHLVIK